jgi:tyrosine-specific transport protein
MDRTERSASTRFFSNLIQDRQGLSHQPGSVLGSTALIAGTTIGAGILALPAFTLPSGIIPSTVLLITVWLYALAAGLLIAEANLNLMRMGRSESGLLSMISETLGVTGARVAGGVYLFMHYALLVAYMSQGGEILLNAIERFSGTHALADWLGVVLFTALFGGILYLGHQRFVERINSAFVAIVLLSFAGLLLFGIREVNPAQFLIQDWQALSPALSVMFVALFYHNVIPVVTTQLEGDVVKIRQSIVTGSLIPLVMFLVWNAVVLGSIRPEMLQETVNGSPLFDPLKVLRNGAAGDGLGVLISVFSEFAIVTSFIGFVYGLLDFFQDLWKVSPGDRTQRLPLYSLVFLPSISFSTLNPGIFFTALDYVGTFSISVLGGMIPAIIIWKQRYEQETSDLIQPLVPGGRLMLSGMIVIALIIILRQFLLLLQ